MPMWTRRSANSQAAESEVDGLENQKKKNLFTRIGMFLRVKQNRRLLLMPGIPVLVLSLLALIAIFAPLLAPHDPTLVDMRSQFLSPAWAEDGSAAHVLGTDYYGRDILSRLIYGTRTSLFIVSVALGLSALIGTIVGMISGYCGGVVDAVLMRIADALIAIPYLVVAIAFACLVGASMTSTICIIVIFQWAIYAKQVRASTLSLKEQDFVALARVAGASNWRIITRHILPNVVPTVLVLVTLHIGGLILWESTLSYLGVGVPSNIPSWGTMISDGKNYVLTRPLLSALPGVAILITVFAANVFGDWLRDKLDPKLRQQ